jgi:hypothetical protein
MLTSAYDKVLNSIINTTDLPLNELLCPENGPKRIIWIFWSLISSIGLGFLSFLTNIKIVKASSPIIDAVSISIINPSFGYVLSGLNT